MLYDRSRPLDEKSYLDALLLGHTVLMAFGSVLDGRYSSSPIRQAVYPCLCAWSARPGVAFNIPWRRYELRRTNIRGRGGAGAFVLECWAEGHRLWIVAGRVLAATSATEPLAFFDAGAMSTAVHNTCPDHVLNDWPLRLHCVWKTTRGPRARIEGARTVHIAAHRETDACIQGDSAAKRASLRLSQIALGDAGPGAADMALKIDAGLVREPVPEMIAVRPLPWAHPTQRMRSPFPSTCPRARAPAPSRSSPRRSRSARWRVDPHVEAQAIGPLAACDDETPSRMTNRAAGTVTQSKSTPVENSRRLGNEQGGRWRAARSPRRASVATSPKGHAKLRSRPSERRSLLRRAEVQAFVRASTRPCRPDRRSRTSAGSARHARPIRVARSARRSAMPPVSCRTQGLCRRTLSRGGQLEESRSLSPTQASVRPSTSRRHWPAR